MLNKYRIAEIVEIVGKNLFFVVAVPSS